MHYRSDHRKREGTWVKHEHEAAKIENDNRKLKVKRFMLILRKSRPEKNIQKKLFALNMEADISASALDFGILQADVMSILLQFL